MTQKIACISLNLDSIGHAIGESPLENDPTFNVVFKRIESIIDKYNIKISIFVIGKDLENKKNLNYVKEWFNKGHEIGNHTYTHPINFGYLDKKQIYEEIKKTDDLIFKATNKKSEGFIAPNWNSSKNVLSVLNKFNYRYDHSLFSSPVLILGLVKLFYNYLKVLITQRKPSQTYNLSGIFQRKDYLNMFIGKRKPFNTNNSYLKPNLNKDNITIYPIPNKFKLPYWLTIDFVFPKKLADFIFKLNIKNNDFFYLLIHPADFISKDDLVDIDGTHSFERMSIDLEYKVNLFEKRIKQLLDEGYKFKTFNKL